MPIWTFLRTTLGRYFNRLHFQTTLLYRNINDDHTIKKELASLGLDRLKSALMALNLKCGGTLQERAIRLFQTKGKRLQDLDPSLFAKAQNSKKYLTKIKALHINHSFFFVVFLSIKH